MKISEVCAATGLTKKAIDYYQQKEIVDPDVDESGYRRFDELDVQILKKVSALRSLGLSVCEIKPVLDSSFPKQELRKCIIRKQMRDELSRQQTQLLERLLDGEDIEEIDREILELNKKSSIKEKLLDAFPGFYGRFYLNHFSQFLDEPIETQEQKQAYETVVHFLDHVSSPKISDEVMEQFEEAMDFWTDEKIAELDGRQQQSIENPKEFLEDYSEAIEQYQAFKESEEYKSSPYGQLMEAMKAFGETSGYNDVFIPAMRRLSPSYDKYYKQLMEANKVFLEKYPDYS